MRNVKNVHLMVMVMIVLFVAGILFDSNALTKEDPALQLYLDFETDGDPGKDKSDYEHDASNIKGNPTPVAGILGKGLKFDGVDDSIELAPTRDARPDLAYIHDALSIRSVDMWFKAEDTDMRIFYEEGGTYGFTFRLNKDDVEFATRISQ